MKCVEETNRKATGSPEPRRGRKICHSADVNWRIDFQETKALTRDIILDFLDLLDLFRLGIVQTNRLVK